MPVRADLSRITLRSVREGVNDPDTYGVTPGLALVTSSIMTTENLKGAPEIKQSKISKPNRLPGQRRKTYVAGQGTVNFECLFCAEFDAYLEEGLCETFTTINVSSALISAATSDNSINDESVGGTLFANIPKGAWIPISGFVTAGNNTGADWAYVASKPTARKLILAYHTLAAIEAVGPTVVISSRWVRDGTKLISRTWERDHTDLSANRYRAFPGGVVDKLDLNFNFEEILEGSLGIVSKAPLRPSATSVGTGSPTPAVDVSALTDATNNMRAFRTGGVLDGNIKTLSISLSNNTEAIRLAQTGSAVGVSLGTAALSGNVEGILLEADGRQLKAFDRTAESIHFRVTDDNGKTYYFTIWRLKYDDEADVAKSGPTGPGMTQLPWTAEEDPSIGHWIQVCASPAS